MRRRAGGIHYRHRDGNSTPHALGDDAEVLELFEAAILVRQVAELGLLTQVHWILAGLAAVLVAACSYVRHDVPRPSSYALELPGETFLGRSVKPGFRLLVSGQEAFVARAALAESAERTLCRWLSGVWAATV